MKKRIFPLVLAAAMLLSGCAEGGGEPIVTTAGDTDKYVEYNNTTVFPENVLQIGETFDYYPDQADGHFECTVTDVWVVSEQSQCPPKEDFYWDDLWSAAYVDGEWVKFEYEEWFTENGVFDYGAQIIMVDMTVKNIDAVAWLDNGTYYGDCGYFNDEYAFRCSNILYLTDLSVLYGPIDKYYGNEMLDYFSKQGEFAEEDIPDTLGTETYAFRLMPGETTSFTIGFFINGGEDGKPADLSLRWLNIVNVGTPWNTVAEGLFIDTNLG